jgi:protoheme IX farnesyltransferase
MLGYTGWISAVIVGITGLFFFYQTIVLYRTIDTKDARSLMFGSFIYLPIVMIALLLDKL